MNPRNFFLRQGQLGSRGRTWQWLSVFWFGIAATFVVLVAMAITTRSAAEQRRSAEIGQSHTVEVLRT